jgi:hypothetical protein
MLTVILRGEPDTLVGSDLIATTLALIDAIVWRCFTRLPNLIEVLVIIHRELTSVLEPSHDPKSPSMMGR